MVSYQHTGMNICLYLYTHAFCRYSEIWHNFLPCQAAKHHKENSRIKSMLFDKDSFSLFVSTPPSNWKSHFKISGFFLRINSACSTTTRVSFFNVTLQSRHVGVVASYVIRKSTGFTLSNVQTNLKASICWMYVRGIYRWPVDSPHKGPKIWKSFYLIPG